MQCAAWYGDNLEIMKKLPSNSVDLIYLDPPFNSKRNYNQIYKDEFNRPLPEEALAFCDAWTFTEEKEDVIRNFSIELREQGADDNFISLWETGINALRHTNSKLLAYLVFMTVRLWEMHRLLKDTGSLYLHCDPTASHYIKVFMDGIFGHNNFVNEIVWSYKTGGASKHHFNRKHDIILFYAKNNKMKIFNQLKEKSYNRGYKKYGFKKGTKEYKDTKCNMCKKELSENIGWYTYSGMRDVWEINAVGRTSAERMGYPTQKPLALLDRIIQSSCPKDGIVLDPFCGCGTTLDAAQSLNRKWIGIDICLIAIKRIEERLVKKYNYLNKNEHYAIKGLPITINQVEEMIQSSDTSRHTGRYKFQYWAIEQVGGFASTKKTGDGGVDGAIYFYKSLRNKDKNKSLGRMILSVKSDKKIHIAYLRELIGVMTREGADMAGLICMDIPSDNMKAEARAIGTIELEGILGYSEKIPKIQILTAQEILKGERFIIPDYYKYKK